MLVRRAITVGILVIALAACGFTNTIADEASGVTPDAGAGNDAERSPAGIVDCDTPDGTGLVVCLEFEDSMADGVLDDSSPARRHAVTAGVAQVADAERGGMAADIGPQASTYVPQSAALDLAAGYTLAAWVKPETIPPNGTARGILDHEGQYAMIASATTAGAIHNRCQHTGVSRYEYTERLPVGTWSFLACTWDGTELCAYRWASPTDRERYCHRPTLGPSATGSRGLAVGHLSSNGTPHGRFDGALDSVQVYSRRLTEAQLCALIGQAPGCMPCNACE